MRGGGCCCSSLACLALSALWLALSALWLALLTLWLALPSPTHAPTRPHANRAQHRRPRPTPPGSNARRAPPRPLARPPERNCPPSTPPPLPSTPHRLPDPTPTPTLNPPSTPPPPTLNTTARLPPTSLIHQQYSQEATVGAILSRLVSAVPIMGVFIFYTTRHKHTRAGQLALLALSLFAGPRLLWVLAHKGYAVNVRQAPPLATAWIYAVAQLELGPALVSLALVGGWARWAGLGALLLGAAGAGGRGRRGRV
ncbi:hypothetical protein HDZ31DRAFT_68375 [Schizophyllum fasciatum]